MVSIVMLTCNHEQFIAKAIESVLSQETHFRYELLVGDDHSSDQTTSIVKGYTERYPDIVKLVVPEKEKRVFINGRPTGRYNLINCFAKASGKYIAFCDGDDYWTSPQKLHQQVLLLESHSRSGCFHMAHIHNLTTGAMTPNYGMAMPEIVNQDDIYIFGNHIPTVSVMFRKDKLPAQYPEWFYTTPYGDMVLYRMLLAGSSFERMNEHWAVYNLSGTGLFSSTSKKQQGVNELQSFVFPISVVKAIQYLFTAPYFRKLALQHFSTFIRLLLLRK